jgi:hypothetical protein
MNTQDANVVRELTIEEVGLVSGGETIALGYVGGVAYEKFSDGSTEISWGDKNGKWTLNSDKGLSWHPY